MSPEPPAPSVESTEEEKPPEESKSEQLVLREDQSLAPLNPLQRYLLELKEFKPLSSEEEHKLAVRYRDEGDETAAYQLITSNLSLVVKIARLYNRVYHNVIDLIQEGNIGLIEAVTRFDPHKGNRLPTYASWWIKAYIIKFIIDNFRIVRIGTTNERRRLLFNLKKEKEKLRMQGIDLRLDAYVGDDQKLQYSDTLRAAEEQVDERLARGELRQLFNEKLKEFSASLNERELTILKERLVAEEPLTLQQIAEQYGVTREAIRLNEKSLIKRIKEYMESALSGVTDVEIGLLS